MKSTALLLADNNLSYLDIVREKLCLNDNFYQVDVATTSEECFEKLLENHYQLLLLDYDIDCAKGHEVLSRIVKSGMDIPVVMMVDDGCEDIGFESVQNGAFDFLVKKRGHLDSIADHVDQILKKRQNNKHNIDENEVFELKDPSFSLSKDTEKTNGQGYYVLTRKGKFLNINESLKKALNFQERELFELTLEDLILPDDVQSYYQWLACLDFGTGQKPFQTQIVGKYGRSHSVEISMTPVCNKNNEIMNYKGYIKFITEKPNPNKLIESNGHFNQSQMIQEMTNLIHFGYESSLNHLLERIVQSACKLFRFKRATLALLDRRRKMFIKQIMIGYTNGSTNGNRILEVPQNVIQKIFVNQFKVRVIYHNQEINHNNSVFSSLEERRLQKRDSDAWHPNNVVILNLTDQRQQTFGYISMDEPLKQSVPGREIFYNLELFSDLTSIAIENFYRYSAIEKRNRRLKRLLVTGNIFKLDLSGPEIMRESVWSIKFSLNFNLVMLGLIKSQNDQFDIKSVACDDRIKSVQLRELSIPVRQIQTVLKNEYRLSKSYFVNKPEPALRKIKDIYYDTKTEHDGPQLWQWWKMLIVPIFEEHNKIIGFILVDDPEDFSIPSQEVTRTLEIFSSQLSIAIQNRAMYLKLKNKLNKNQNNNQYRMSSDSTDGGLKKLVETFFK